MIKTHVDIKDTRDKWDKLTKNAQDTSKGIKSANAVNIGLFKEQGEDMATYMAKNEFGTTNDVSKNFYPGEENPMIEPRGKIPARPFMRLTFDEQKKILLKMIDKAKNEIVLSKNTKDAALLNIGKFFRDKLKQKIWSNYFKNIVPNAELTIALKGHDQPLVDTERAVRSLTFRLGKKTSNKRK